MKPNLQSAYQLFLQGTQVFAEVEQFGFRVDTEYYKAQYEAVGKQIQGLYEELRDSKLGQKWYDEFGAKRKLSSPQQLLQVLQKRFHVAVDSTAKDVLEEVDLPELDTVAEIRRLDKVRGSFILPLIQEEVNGYLHPSFNLHLVRTHRSQSDSPNMQNVPKRDKRSLSLVRRGILPRPGHQLVEIDLSGAEVRTAACYNHDPKLITYIEDKSTDMHRDMASQCFKVALDNVSKELRYCGKNMFVFPEFYGSYYAQVAKAMWKARRKDIRLKDGTKLEDHMGLMGWKRYEDFEAHVRKVEEDFWGRRFKVYDEWKKDWYARYCKKGYFTTLTGFLCGGYMKFNEAVNFPLQGSAFHINLWATIQLHEWLKKTGKKSRILGQVHDSIILDCPPEELEIVVIKAHRLLTVNVRQHWDWIIVPLEVEAEVSAVDGNWSEMVEYPIED